MTLDYLAGLLDGEGSLQLAKGSSRNSSTWRQPRLRVVMTTPAPLHAAQAEYGGAVYGPYHRDAPRKSFYIWSLSKRAELLPLLEAVAPRLLVKGPDAERLLAYIGAHPLHVKTGKAVGS